MLTKDDIKEIGLEFGKVIEHNITPQFQGINEQFQGVNERLDRVESRLDKVENRLNGVENRLDKVENRLNGVESRLDKVESQMVTKTYLDDKLADLEGSVVSRQRKEDQKVNRLIEILQNKKLLEEAEVKQLNEFQIFPASTGKSQVL